VVGQVDGDLTQRVSGSVANHQTPRAELEEPQSAHRVVGAKRREAALPALAVLRGQLPDLLDDPRGVALHLGGEAIVRQRLSVRPPRLAEHVIPVRVREHQRQGASTRFLDHARHVVDLGREDAGVHQHDLLGVEQRHGVHLKGGALTHVNAAIEPGPGR
jgi:hypothetical protein